MAGLFNALNAAKTSLEVNQKSIEVVGNNVANVNTPGYSRQHTQLTPYPSVNFGGYFIGQGVKVSDVKRDHDIFLENQLVTKTADFGYQNSQAQPLSQLENVFNVSDNNISTDINKFFDSWQQLTTDPSDLVLRDTVIQNGKVMSQDFNNASTDLDTISSNINDSISSGVEDINSKISQIAQLNDQIYRLEVHGQTDNSDRDQRENLAKDLAQTVGAQTYYTSNGMMTVQLPGGLPLVQGTAAMSIEAQNTGGTQNLILHAGGVDRTIDQTNIGGEFKGLMYLRDTYIPNLQDGLDRLAYEISTQVNTQHAAGAGLDSVTGRNFFSDPPNLGAGPPTEYVDAARQMSVAITDPAQIAAAQAPGGGGTVAPGDNRNALAISNLDQTYLIGGVDNFNSYYGKLTADVGITTNQNTLNLQGAQDAVTQIANLKDGSTGVSLDQEMIDMITYQRGFESSAKLLSTVDDMMSTLMTIKR